MDSNDRFWALFWTLVTTVILALMLAISISVRQESTLKFEAQRFCMERNGHWMTRIKRVQDEPSTITHTCEFTR